VRPPTIQSKRQRVSWSRLPARPTTIAVLDHREQGGDLVSQRATARRVVAGPVGRLALDQDGDPVRVATSDLIDRGVDGVRLVEEARRSLMRFSLRPRR
jgi:hypothetical protein